MKRKVKAHLWTLPRWFAAPFFGAPVVLGALLAGGMTRDSWLGLLTVLLVMAGSHSFNSFLDYAWTGLDRGDPEDRSAEKDYCGGQSIIAAGIVSTREVALNATSWYILALAPVVYLATRAGWPVLLIALAGMSVTFGYAQAKFNWTHELVLGIGTGPLPLLAGMFATSASPPWTTGLVASVPFMILPSFAGLALDEWPDAEANLKKGVRSIAYKVWECGVSLEWYFTSWITFMFIYQVFLISADILAPLTAISFLTWPGLISAMVFLRRDFRKAAGVIVLIALAHPVLLVAGQALGS